MSQDFRPGWHFQNFVGKKVHESSLKGVDVFNGVLPFKIKLYQTLRKQIINGKGCLFQKKQGPFLEFLGSFSGTNIDFGETYTSPSDRSLPHQSRRLVRIRIEDSGKLAQTGRNLWPEEQQAPALLYRAPTILQPSSTACDSAATSASSVILLCATVAAISAWSSAAAGRVALLSCHTRAP